MNLLGASLVGQKNYADAEPLLLQSCQELQQRQASLSPILNAPRRITESLERLVQLYTPGANPPQPPSGDRNWPRSSRPPKRWRRKRRSHDESLLQRSPVCPGARD